MFPACVDFGLLIACVIPWPIFRCKEWAPRRQRVGLPPQERAASSFVLHHWTNTAFLLYLV